MLAGAFFGGISLMTRRHYWALSEHEQDEMGEAISGVMPTISPAAAKALSQASPWVRLALVSGTIVANRVAMDAGAVRPVLRSVPSPTPQAPAGQTETQAPAPARPKMPDVLFPAPRKPSMPQPTAAEAAAELAQQTAQAADLPPIFAGEAPRMNPLVAMTTGSGKVDASGANVAPAFDVPGLDGA